MAVGKWAPLILLMCPLWKEALLLVRAFPWNANTDKKYLVPALHCFELHSRTSFHWKVYPENVSPFVLTPSVKFRFSFIGSLVILSIIIKSLTKIFLSETFDTVLDRRRRLFPKRGVWICVHENLWFIPQKIWAFFHDPRWCHLFTVQCFEQKSRKSVYITSPPLGNFHGLKQVTRPSIQLFYLKTKTMLLHVLRMGWVCRDMSNPYALQFPSIHVSPRNHPLPLEKPSRPPVTSGQCHIPFKDLPRWTSPWLCNSLP